MSKYNANFLSTSANRLVMFGDAAAAASMPEAYADTVAEIQEAANRAALQKTSDLNTVRLALMLARCTRGQIESALKGVAQDKQASKLVSVLNALLSVEANGFTVEGIAPKSAI